MIVDLHPLADWLSATAVSLFIQNHEWVWPSCETLHFIGLALVIGNVGLLDLRLLGVEKRLPFAPLNWFVQWAVIGFAINLATGIIFFVGNPQQYITNVAFAWKLAFMAVAGLNVLVFYATGLFRKVEKLGPGEDAPVAAKIIAATSLLCWIGVMYMGRMLPYIGNSF